MGFTKAEEKMLKVLGGKLRALRMEKGISLIDLGHLIDKDHQSISRVERGETNPTYLYLEQLCTGLEIDLKDLFQP